MNPHLLTGAYAVDALPPEDRHAFTDHLRACADCADEVHSLESVVAALGAAARTEPPPRLRADVLARIGQVRQLPPEPAPAPPLATPVPTPVPVPTGPPRHRRRRVVDGWRVGLGLLAAAAIAATVVLGVRIGSLTGQVDDARTRAVAVSQVLTADDVRVNSASLPNGGRAAIATSRALGRTAVVADGVPAAPPGRTYQLWWLDADGGARSAGVLNAAGGGLSGLLDGPRGRATAVGITVEPMGGSTAPTTPVLASVALSS